MKKEEKNDFNIIIKNRNNILGWALIFVILLSLILAIIFGRIILDLSEFSFSDLVALIISLWAVYVSILFYHKNNEVSREFYNNFYVFIKDVTEKIGKLDVGVKEQMESLKEKVEYSKNNGKSDEEYKKEITELKRKDEENNRKLKESEDNLHDILNELYDKTQASEDMKTKINELTDEVLKYKNNSNIINRKLRVTEKNKIYYEMLENLNDVFSEEDLMDLMKAPNEEGAKEIYSCFDSLFEKEYLDYLIECGIMNNKEKWINPDSYERLITIYRNTKTHASK